MSREPTPPWLSHKIEQPVGTRLRLAALFLLASVVLFILLAPPCTIPPSLDVGVYVFWVTVAISTSQLVRTFGDHTAVAGVDLEVPAGEIYGFLGPNGAGKSTCVKMLCTLLRPTSGTATVAGFDIAADATEVRLRIGVALQDAALDPKLTGRELLDFQGRIYGLTHRQTKMRIEALSGLIEMDAIDRRVATYSGGMKRRLDLAAALIHSPQVVFLDEPTTGLDPESRAKVWDEVERINATDGVTVFLTTQYLDEAERLADRVGIISAGRLVVEGTPDQLKRQVGSEVINVRVNHGTDHAVAAVRNLPGVEEVKVVGDEIVVSVSDGSATLAPVAVALDACGAQVTDLRLHAPTLDDVFFAVTGGRFDEVGR